MLSMSEAARAAGVASHRIKYALETRKIPEPGRAGGRRCFAPEDVERIRRHFAAAGSARRNRCNERGRSGNAS